jgi:branched-chain amino acid transport system permease protein
VPNGEYFTDYGQRLGLVRWRIEKVALLLGLPVPFLLPFVLNSGDVGLLTSIFITAIAVLGLNVIVGYAGEIVLAQGAFMAIGGYTANQILGYGVGLIPAALAGGLMTALVALAFGLPAARVKGFYIAISTLALQFIAEWFFQNADLAWLHGGGLQYYPSELGLVGGMVMVAPGNSLYWVSLASFLVFAVVSFNLRRTSLGRMFRAVNDNDLAAEVLGVDVLRMKLLAFLIGGFMIGFSGALWGFYLSVLSPEFFTLDVTLNHYIMLFLGGIGTVWGAILGTGLITFATELLRELVPYFGAFLPLSNVAPLKQVVFGVLIIVVLILEPKGLMSILSSVKEYLRSWPYAY